jgi:hypothetical protein
VVQRHHLVKEMQAVVQRLQTLTAQVVVVLVL